MGHGNVSFRFILLALLCAMGLTRPVHAQQPAVRVLGSQAGSTVVEMTATWPVPLEAAARAGARLDRGLAMTVTQGLLTTSEPVVLPALVEPRVRIVAADYDEVRLPPADSVEALLGQLNRPAARAEALGVERKQPTVTLVGQWLTYDEASTTLRRYRRLVIALDYPAAAARRDALSQATRASGNPHVDVTRSALADGTVFKIPVRQEGLYRIDRAFLEGLGLSPDGIEPNNLKILGNGGAPLPALNSAPRPADVVENPVFVRGGGDGSFGASDVLIFYAAGPSGWTYNASTGEWEHYVHPFSSDNYYFLKVDAEAGARVEAPAFPALPDARPFRQTTGRYVVERDDEMWSKEGGTGHTWVSPQIRTGGRLALLADQRLPGLGAGEVRYRARVAIQSNPAASVFFQSGGATLAEARAGAVGFFQESPAALATERAFSQPAAAGEALDLSMTIENVPNDPRAALDWLRVMYVQELRAEDGYLRFATPPGEAGSLELVLQGFAQEPQVWDVTEPGAIRRLGVQASGGEYRVQVSVDDPDRPRELVAFTEGALRQPEADPEARVAPQNLHGIQAYPDFVIVTPATFRESAEDLADHRRQEGLLVTVALVDQIYNEFSGGLPDPRAVRDYFRFLYDRAPGEQMPRYALLFGDGHFNYRSLGPVAPELENWVLPYETDESFDPIKSYTSDDYFGLLDANEGLWVYNTRSERVDLGIGRFPVQTPGEAQAVVEKIKHYESAETFGAWRTRYLFVADDGPTGLAGQQDDLDLHVQNADVVAELVENLYPEVNLQKIYGVSYNRVFQNGWRLPEAEKAIDAALNEGVLLFNYSGHGGEDELAQEAIFTKEDAERLENYDRLSVYITATCSFGRWDIDREQSGAEALLLNDRGGAVAVLSTVRLVYTSSNINTLNVGLNRKLNEELFRLDEQGLPRRLGDVVLSTKNSDVGSEPNNRKFNLLGDPTMRLGFTSRRAVVRRVNDVPVEEQTAPIRALDRILLAGEVVTGAGVVDGGFNGVVNVAVFDAERQVALPYQRHMPTPYYTVREDLIWRGDVQATNGLFEATFVVPKDISYSDRPGRISVYAQSGDRDALGYTQNVVVGGTAPNPPDDAEGPQISLFLNDTTFVSGGLAPPDPELIVRLFDTSGINTVGAGVGHEMLLVVDGEESGAVDIGDRFQSAENSYQRGEVRYPLSQYSRTLEPGPHTLSVRAWDVLNNSGVATIDFILTEEADLTLRNVYNYPNPTSGETRFIFEHNQRPGTSAEVEVRIYTVTGRPVRTIEPFEALPAGVLPGGPVQVAWDGRDDDFDPLATGVYLYKVRVEVEGPEGERAVSEHIDKVAIIR